MRLLTTIIFCSFFLTSVASAKGKIIFDLKRQYFSGTLIKKGEEGFGGENKYDVGAVIVTTDTHYSGYSYRNGTFTIDIKDPLPNWNVNIKKKNGTQGDGEITTIRLTSEDGTSHFISFLASNGDKNYDSIQINDKDFKTERIQKQSLTSTILMKKGRLIFKINGKTFLKTDDKNFGKLEKVEVELNDNYHDDELLSLDISEVTK